MEERGRHFVLHLLKFVFGISGRLPLPKNAQYWLNSFRQDQKSPFAGKITKALIIYISDSIDNVNNLALLSTPAFKNELHSIAKDEDFLKFVGRYSVKVLEEFVGGNHNAVTSFNVNVTEFLKNILIEEGSVTDFLENWKKAADKVLKEPENQNLQIRTDPTIFVDLTKEKSFIVDVMNFVLDLFEASEDLKLPSENSQNLLTSNIKSALNLSVHHHKEHLVICEYEHLQDYYYRRCIKKFNEKDFIELCASCVGNITLKNACLETSEEACDLLLSVIDLAKKNGKFTTFAELHVAAKDLIEDFEKLYGFE